MGEEGTLSSHHRRDSIGGARKGYKKGITLCVDLVTTPLPECETQELATIFQEAGVALTKLLEKVRRSLDVSKEQGDRSRRQLRSYPQITSIKWGNML